MRRSTAIVFLIGLIVLSLLVGGCDSRKVPNVVGMKQADAVRALQDAGYLLGDVTAVATDTVQLGRIAAQSPEADERAKKDSKVALMVSFSDGKRVIVPTVTELSATTAETVATSLNLVPMIVEQYSEDVAKDTVASQVPDPGAEVDSGATFVIVVSKGPAPEKAKVPDVNGKTQADAESAIKAAGFVPKVYKAYSSSVAKGKVGAQVPDAGTSQTTGSEVEVIVSLGAGTGAIKVPAVTGKKEADAASALKSAGLVAVKIYEYDATVASGIVISQFPDAGTTAASGSEAIILISRGPEPTSAVPVPDVVGMTEAEAMSALDAAGFTVTVEPAPGTPEGDSVMYQFPAAGAKVAPGSEVLVVTGSGS